MRINPFQSAFILVLAFVFISPLEIKALTAFNPADYNLRWNDPTGNEANSMLAGNGEVGANIWIRNNAIHIALARSDAWNECALNTGKYGGGEAMLPKIGKITVQLNPDDFGSALSQVLKLEQGMIEVETGAGSAKKTVRIWIDANAPDLRIEAHGAQNFPMKVSFDPDFGYATDHISSIQGNGIYQYHRNPATSALWDDATREQKVNPAHYPNPLANRTFGFGMAGKGFTATGNTLQGMADTAHYCIVRTHTGFPASPEAWVKEVKGELDLSLATDWAKTFSAHKAWWNSFWNRSYIVLDDTRKEITTNNLLIRYVNACQGRGNYPAHFNGGLFTEGDTRLWGAGYWIQNTRHLYWSNLASGDFDLMQPFFKLYTDLLPIRKEQTLSHFGHAGAYYPETIWFFGLWRNSDFGNGTTTINEYVGLHYDGMLEILSMMIDYFAYTGDAEFAKTRLLPYAKEILTFWDKHWARKNGKLEIIANALETVWGGVNPVNNVAGLRWNLDQLLKLPNTVVPDSLHRAWLKLRGETPELPMQNSTPPRLATVESGGSCCHNEENAQLYAVFPYRIFGVGKPDLAIGIEAFSTRGYIQSCEWAPDAIQAAYLGQTDLAYKYASENLRNSDQKFPVTKGGIADGFPQWESPNVGKMALQTMLMQSDGDTIRLFPAWKPEWDVCFKLHAPKNTTVQACLEKGHVVSVSVEPQNRANDILSSFPLPKFTIKLNQKTRTDTSNRIVKIVDLKSGRILFRKLNENGKTINAEFSPNGKIFIRKN